MSRSDHILVSPVEGPAADGADEACNVIDGKASAHHQIVRQETLAASAALDAKPAFVVPPAKEAPLFVVARMGEGGMALRAEETVLVPG